MPHGDELAVDIYLLVLPQAAHDVEILLEASRPLIGCHAERVPRKPGRTDTHAESHTPIRQVVNRHYLAGQPNRLVERQDGDGETEADRTRMTRCER